MSRFSSHTFWATIYVGYNIILNTRPIKSIPECFKCHIFTKMTNQILKTFYGSFPIFTRYDELKFTFVVEMKVSSI